MQIRGSDTSASLRESYAHVRAGVDNRLMGWDPATLKEASKHKLDAKANTTCMAASCRGFVASGTPSLLVCVYTRAEGMVTSWLS